MRARGISPVVATLLLILIAVAAAVLVYVWVTGYASSMAQTSAPELEEQIKIDSVSVNPTNNYINVTVYVRNIGDVKVNITDLYIIDPSGKIIAHCKVVYDSVRKGGVLDPGEVGAFHINATEAQCKYDSSLEEWKSIAVTDSTPLTTSNLQPGTAYIAKAVTKNGIEAAISFKYQT